MNKSSVMVQRKYSHSTERNLQQSQVEGGAVIWGKEKRNKERIDRQDKTPNRREKRQKCNDTLLW